MDITHWETSIGKSKANDVVLPLPSVSRFHAVIAKKKDGWMVTDTFSKNGVQVNGVPVDQRAPLADGDILMIDTIPLQFLCKEAISTDDRSQMRTAARQSRGQTVAYGVLVDAETHRPVYIKKQDVLIGRGEDADIQLLSPTVSAHHARLRRTSKGWAVYDLDSHNQHQAQRSVYYAAPADFLTKICSPLGTRCFCFTKNKKGAALCLRRKRQPPSKRSCPVLNPLTTLPF